MNNEGRERQIERLIGDGAIGETLRSFNDELRALGRASNTRINYVKVLRTLAGQTQKPFQALSKQDILQFINGIENDATRESYKVLLKRFYRWLYDMKKGQYPAQVDWMVVQKVKTKVTKDQLLTPEELKRVIRHAGRSRDKAFIATSWEAGDRPGEHLSLKVGSVEATDYGFILHLQLSKTKTRSVPIHQTARHLAQWLNDHPFRDDPRAPLWISLSKRSYGQPLGYSGIYNLVKLAKRRAGIEKPLSSKWLRHDRLTDLAKKVREPQLKAIAGWTPDSRMVATYIHLSGMDTVEPILEAEGVKPHEVMTNWIEPQACPRCETVNDSTAMYCGRCGSPLTGEVDSLLLDMEQLSQLPGWNEFFKSMVEDAKTKLAALLKLQKLS